MSSTLPPVMIPPQPPPAGERRVTDGGDSVTSSESDEGMMRSSSGKYSLVFDMSVVSSPVAVPNDHEEVDFTPFPHVSGEKILDSQSSVMDTRSASNPLKETPTKAERRALQEDQRAAKAARKVSGEKILDSQSSVMDTRPASNPLKEKTTKAERRALQDAQRAAKAAQKAEAFGMGSCVIEKPVPVTKQRPPKKDPPLAGSDTKRGDRSVETDRKKNILVPRMQYDNESRVEKEKKRSVFKQTAVKNQVELFQHLPPYGFGNQLSDLESKFFEHDKVHHAVYKVGLQYLAGNITGSNARCIAMLYAFKEAIEDYHTPPEKTLTRDLTSRISSYISYLNECRPLSISMGNAIRSLKTQIAKLPLSLSESEAKSALLLAVDCYINEKIIIANRVIVQHAATKIRDGDVLLTYACSSVVEMVLLYAHEIGKNFSIVIVDSRPKLEGQGLLRRLVTKGLRCTYTHINAVSYVMHEVTKVLLGAASVLSNGTVYSRIGTACVAMVAHSFRVPVLVCCEAYKFHERVQLDSICGNELGDPDAISNVPGGNNVDCLASLTKKESLQFLNILYDVTPSDYISLIVTDYGMVPPTSIPVIVREYRKEHLF